MTTVTPSEPGAPARDQGRRRAKSAAAPARPEPARVPAGQTSLTVKLSPASMESLSRAARVSEINLTDTVNRAVQLYDFVVTALAENKHNALVLIHDGHPSQIHVR
jgi:hypothetical protein